MCEIWDGDCERRALPKVFPDVHTLATGRVPTLPDDKPDSVWNRHQRQKAFAAVRSVLQRTAEQKEGSNYTDSLLQPQQRVSGLRWTQHEEVTHFRTIKLPLLLTSASSCSHSATPGRSLFCLYAGIFIHSHWITSLKHSMNSLFEFAAKCQDNNVTLLNLFCKPAAANSLRTIQILFGSSQSSSMRLSYLS